MQPVNNSCPFQIVGVDISLAPPIRGVERRVPIPHLPCVALVPPASSIGFAWSPEIPGVTRRVLGLYCMIPQPPATPAQPTDTPLTNARTVSKKRTVTAMDAPPAKRQTVAPKTDASQPSEKDPEESPVDDVMDSQALWDSFLPPPATPSWSDPF